MSAQQGETARLSRLIRPPHRRTDCGSVLPCQGHDEPSSSGELATTGHIAVKGPGVGPLWHGGLSDDEAVCTPQPGVGCGGHSAERGHHAVTSAGSDGGEPDQDACASSPWSIPPRPLRWRAQEIRCARGHEKRWNDSGRQPTCPSLRRDDRCQRCETADHRRHLDASPGQRHRVGPP